MESDGYRLIPDQNVRLLSKVLKFETISRDTDVDIEAKCIVHRSDG